MLESPPADEPEDRAFDSYLDAALGGVIEDPEQFLRRRPECGSALRPRIEALHRLAGAAAGPAPRPHRTADDGLPRERVGEFRLLREIGRGGMGTVYEAEQSSLARPVALKVIRSDLRSSPEARERFRREALAAARLRHPGIVSVHGAGEEEGLRWIAFDLAPGTGLDEIIAESSATGRPLAPARVARWGARLARALEYAHARGIVHRDVKPSNVRIGPEDRPVLLDFGIARDASAESTITGPMLGSPHYAAPEQIRGEPADGRADVYGLGATLYECLAGAPPFQAPTVDGVLHRALVMDPGSLRSRRPDVPADLDAIVLHCLEKDPARRYPGAREQAEDLEALLEFRPVVARRAAAWRRLGAWARARPSLASAAATGVVAAIALAVLLVHGKREEGRRTRAQAVAEVDAAAERLRAFRTGRTAAEDAERSLAALRDEVESQYLTAAQDHDLDRLEREVHAHRRDREAAFHAALQHLRRAEQLDPRVAGVDAVRATLYLERWRDAAATRDEGAEEFYRGLAVAHDPEGTVTRGALGTAPVRFTSEPPGAEVHLFRIVDLSTVRPGGEPRLVPVPLRASAPVPPGSFALRVVRPAGDLREGDLVVEVAGHPVQDCVLVATGSGGVGRLSRLLAVDGARVGDLEDVAAPAMASAGPRDTVPATADRLFLFSDRAGARAEARGPSLAGLGVEVALPRSLVEAGGVPARVWTGDRLRDMELPNGLEVRATAAPLPLSGASALGRTPVASVELERGSYVAHFSAPGFEHQRLHLMAAPGRAPLDCHVVLLPLGSSPAGFVRIPRGATVVRRAFWMQEREVTCAEYLEFLNDPRAREVPGGTEAAAGRWSPGADGRSALPEGWRPDWPALGVSFNDATAYARWRTLRGQGRGAAIAFALPTFEDWLAANAAEDRFYSHGNRFRPKWIKSCFSRRRAAPEPVLAYPRDETPMGVFDTAGSISEWLDAWYDRDRGLRRLAGGCWAYGKADVFRIYGASGWRPERRGDEAGFRLIATGPGDE